jgi:hypothetical protein
VFGPVIIFSFYLDLDYKFKNLIGPVNSNFHNLFHFNSCIHLGGDKSGKSLLGTGLVLIQFAPG